MEEDEDLRRAIELSLQEAGNPPLHRNRTPGSEDDDDEAQFQRDLQAALDASKAEAFSAQRQNLLSTSRADGIAASNPPSNPPSELPTLLPQTERMSSFLNERAKMEQERLDRQKRMRESEQQGSNSLPAAKRQRQSPPPPIQDSKREEAVRRAYHSLAELEERQNLASSSNASNALYWEGELRQTANRLVDADKNARPTFRMSEVIGPKREISFAVLSSYANMIPWMQEFFDPSTPVIVINHPGPDGNSSVEELPIPNWILTRPFLRGGRGCMHIKLMLIFYKDGRLRVALPTANFVDYDWRDIENSVWVQDIPKRQTPIRHDPKATDFPATLHRVLQSLNVPAALRKHVESENDYPDLPIDSLSELRMCWDWSKVKVKLVASLAGKHEGWDQIVRTGHPALMKAVQDLGARTGKSKEIILECQGSSIGSYSTQWMNEIYCSARGDSAKSWLDKPKTQRAKLPWPAVKIVFPSHQTVKDSKLGFPGGGTMFCRKAQWEAKNFPRDLFHDSNSKRGAVLMHSKMILGMLRERSNFSSSSKAKERFTDSEDEDTADELEAAGGRVENIAGWLYVGSHNFTPSAWGTLSGSSSSPILNVLNYELGIVIPLKSQKEADDVACWKRPPRKYVVGRDKPWMQEQYNES